MKFRQMSKTILINFDEFVQNFLKIFSTVFTIFLKFFLRFSEIFSKTTLSLYFYESIVQIYQNLLKWFSTPTWISSKNYQTFLKLFEKQAQNFDKFSVKFTHILSIICSRFLKILYIIYSSFLKVFFYFKISAKFLRIFPQSLKFSKISQEFTKIFF